MKDRSRFAIQIGVNFHVLQRVSLLPIEEDYCFRKNKRSERATLVALKYVFYAGVQPNTNR